MVCYRFFMDLNRQTTIFKALANINRLKIITILAKDASLNVGEIAEKLKISFVATSRHLNILHSLEAVRSVGTMGHVFYSLNRNMPADIRKAIRSFL